MMNDLMSWEPLQSDLDQHGDQIGVYTFYQDRQVQNIERLEQITEEKNRQKEGGKKNKSKRKKKKLYFESQNQCLEQNQKKMSFRGEKKHYKLVDHEKYQKRVMRQKTEPIEKRSDKKQHITNHNKEEVKAKVSETKRTQEKVGLKALTNKVEMIDKKNRCKTSLNDIICSQVIDDGKNIREQTIKSPINFSKLSVFPLKLSSSKLANFIYLNDMMGQINGPEQIYEQINEREKKEKINHFPKIKKSQIASSIRYFELNRKNSSSVGKQGLSQNCRLFCAEQYIQTRQDESNLNKMSLRSYKNRSKSSLKGKNNSSIRNFLINSVDIGKLSVLKNIQLGRKPKKDGSEEWPDDKKAFLRRLGFKF